LVDLVCPLNSLLAQPWLDLSLSHPSLVRNTRTDLLNMGQITVARDCYLHNVFADLAKSLGPPEPTSVPELLRESSFRRLRDAHPLYSPAPAVMIVGGLTNGIAHAATMPLDEIVDKLRANGTKLFVQYGSAEVFAAESEAFLTSVTPATTSATSKPNGSAERSRPPLDVVSLVERGGWHCNATMFSPWDGRSLAGRLLRIGAAESRACGAFGAWLESGRGQANGDAPPSAL
jgi:hypothetical protein